MLSRRQVLSMMLAMPAVNAVTGTARAEILEQPHPLSMESAKGYRLVLKQAVPDCIVVPAMLGLSGWNCRRLMERAKAGACVLLENGACFASGVEQARLAETLRAAFDIRVMPRVIVKSYVDYAWPIQTSVRSFETAIPVMCDEAEMIARCGEMPVCSARQFGSGQVIYLGSPLGPGLFAEEREAHSLATALLAGQVPVGSMLLA